MAAILCFSSSLIFFIVATVSAIAAGQLEMPAIRRAGRFVGGKTEVKDVESNEEVQRLGLFAVQEYNRRSISGGSPENEMVFVKAVTELPAIRRAGRFVGGKTEVSDVESNEEVRRMGLFAVQEYNRRSISQVSPENEMVFVKAVTELPAIRRARRFVGGKTEVNDVESNEEVRRLGLFPSEDYDRRSITGASPETEMVFVKVEKAMVQVVSGLKYYLDVVVLVRSGDGGEKKSFEAVVVVKPWMNSKRLVSFVPSRR